MRFIFRSALVLSLLVAATGCGGKRTDITGTITRDGKPLVWTSEGGHLLVIFFPEPRGNKEPYAAETDREAGTYRIPEIRAGHYRVAIQQFDERHQDALNSKYNPNHSPIYVDVDDDGQVIDIDLPKDLPE